MSEGFFWVIRPEAELIPGLIRYQAQVAIGLRALFNAFAAKMESYARANAPWNDVTGAARQGLRAFVEGAGVQLSIYLVTSAVYGVFLELGTRYMAPRPIILPTMQAHYAALMSAIRALLAGV